MALDREAIDVALFARLIAKTLVTATPPGPMKAWQRRYEPWTNVPPPQAPSGMIIRGPEHPDHSHGNVGAIWHLDRWLIVYANDSGELGSIVDTLLNAIMLAIESALEMQPDDVPSGIPSFPSIGAAPGPTTLGGRCVSCKISGTVETFEGTTGSSIMRIPIEILAIA